MAGTSGTTLAPNEGPSLEDLRKCVHCGICLPQCPTYLTLGEEMDSPRGRIYLMRAVVEGRLTAGETLARHLDLCLGCRACESACPSGVPFGSLLEATRAQLAPRRPVRQRVRTAVLHALLPDPARVGVLLGLLRVYRATGLARLVRATGLLDRFPRLRAMETLIGDVPAADELPEITPAVGKKRGRVGLLAGCVQRHLYPGVNRDTVHLLSLAGWEVAVPRAQGCCGALDVHAGRLEAFRDRARALARAFPADCAFIVTNAAGCGSAMKEYDHWIDEPEMRGFARRTRDVSELLSEAELPLRPLDLTGWGARPPVGWGARPPVGWGAHPPVVTYHDACHLAHGQRIRSEPRELLRRIPGVKLVELPESDLCCGSAGVYNLLEPGIADQLLERKIRRIAETGASIVAAGNPGCLLQIAKGARERGLAIEVVHPVELLARSVEGPR